MTVIQNDKNELITKRTVTGWRVCKEYRKLKSATCKDHFSMPFIDQMLNRPAGRSFYYFLDGYFGYNQINIVLEDQEKTTLTSRAYSRAGLGNDAFSRSIAAFQSPEREGWFQGTADAIRRCLLVYTRGVSSEEFLVPRGYHLCLSDFQKLLEARQNNRADITVAV
ncbi:glucose-1-phosphate adenylyltransferase large subunit 1, chloroplastic-like [Nicotiana tabacum]|uniref:Glucose-1-phosphate adenylyltransferase large subunit 1, chloroplastic-like n=1 Tax=Nicotiana tabacum TaxID=4097 RepID=A0AC58TDA9_TOBAC